MYAEVFPSRIKNARIELGITQVEAAKKLGTSQGTIANYERGHVEPSLEMLAKMAVLYEVTIDWMCGLTAKGGPDIDLTPNQIRESNQILKELERETKKDTRLLGRIE